MKTHHITEKGRYYLKLLVSHSREEAARLADKKYPNEKASDYPQPI